MSFRDDFARTPPSPKREQLVYQTIIKQGKPTDLAPITVPGPNNTKITYYVTKDFLNYDGIWLTMTGTTAQKVADYFHMYLPTPKMSRQIYNQATTKIMPTPLSYSGYGKYSPQDVVNSRINASDAALAYSQKISDEQAKYNKEGIIAGHMKDITQPPPSGKLGLYGWYGSNGKPIQDSNSTPHDISQHTEYGSGVRLIDNKVEVSYPDGHKEEMTLPELMNSNLYSAISDNQGIAKYDISKDKANLPSNPKESEENQVAQNNSTSGRMQILNRIDQYFSNLDKEV